METKPEVNLIGTDGNAFAILAKCKKAAKKAGWTNEKIEEFTAEAKSGDYDNLLTTCCKYFDCN